MFKRLIFIAISPLLLSVSCQNSNYEPCSYDSFKVNIRVIEIRYDSTSNTGEVVLDFDQSSLAEKPQKMSELKDVIVDLDFIERNHITEGNIYSGEVHELTDGNCEKLIFSFDQKIK